MASETFKAARARLHRELAARGNKASRPELKEPWIELPTGDRLWFKPQAVYLNAHSLLLEIRGLSVEDLLAHARVRLRN